MIEGVKRSLPWVRPFGKMVESKVTGKRIPLRVEIHVTKYCNLRCIHCYTDFDNLKASDEPTTEQWKKVIDELHASGTRWLRFLGGEPLMRKDIGELIDYAVSKGMVCDLSTNGYFLKQRVGELKNLASICISIDGDEKANDTVRGKGCYKKIIEGIEAATAAGMTVRLHGVLMRYTKDSIEHLLELSRKYNVSFNLSEAARPDMSDDNMTLSEEERIKFYNKYIQYKRDGWPILNSIPAMEEIMHWPFGDKVVIYPEDVRRHPCKFTRCQQTLKSCMINTDGMVYSCTGRWGQGINCFEHGFQKAWEHLGKTTHCVTCLHLGYNELSRFLSIDSSTIKNAFEKVYMPK